MIVILEASDGALCCGEAECAGVSVVDPVQHGVEVHDDADVWVTPLPDGPVAVGVAGRFRWWFDHLRDDEPRVVRLRMRDDLVSAEMTLAVEWFEHGARQVTEADARRWFLDAKRGMVARVTGHPKVDPNPPRG